MSHDFVLHCSQRLLRKHFGYQFVRCWDAIPLTRALKCRVQFSELCTSTCNAEVWILIGETYSFVTEMKYVYIDTQTKKKYIYIYIYGKQFQNQCPILIDAMLSGWSLMETDGHHGGSLSVTLFSVPEGPEHFTAHGSSLSVTIAHQELSSPFPNSTFFLEASDPLFPVSILIFLAHLYTPYRSRKHSAGALLQGGGDISHTGTNYLHNEPAITAPLQCF